MTQEWDKVAGWYDSTPGATGPSGPPPLDPAIGALNPATAPAGAAVTVTVTGNNFEAGAVVEVDQVAQPTAFVSATELTATYTPTTAGPVTFTVRNGGAGGEESNDEPFLVT